MTSALQERVESGIARWQDRLAVVEQALARELAHVPPRQGILMLLYRDKVLSAGIVDELRRLLDPRRDEP